MNDKPFMISLLIGLIVVLVIAGVSLLVKINSLSDIYKKELSQSISLQRDIEDLRAKNSSLQKTIDQIDAEKAALVENNKSLKDVITKLNLKVDELEKENAKLEKLKEKLEDNLKEELIKEESAE